MSITCSMSWIPRREHRPCERALFAPLNDGENGECAFVFNSIFHHICGCHAVHKIFLVPDLKSVARGLGGHSRKCPPMTFLLLFSSPEKSSISTYDYNYRFTIKTNFSTTIIVKKKKIALPAYAKITLLFNSG